MTLEKPNHLARCPVVSNDEYDIDRKIRLIRTDQQEALTDKQQIDYYDYRRSFLTWLLKIGKEPDKAAGYSPYTVYDTGNRCARFDSWVWENRGGYKMPPTHDDAEAYMEHIAYQDVTESTKGKTLESLFHYNDWLQDNFGADEWEFDWNFQSGGGNKGPRDFLSEDERQKIRQAALDKDGTPAYGVAEVEAESHSWKFTSLVWVSLDAGLRPVEVGNMTTDWCDVQNAALRIPREDSSKNEGNWAVSLRQRTADALERWLNERADHPRYEDTDKVWLTRRGNSYGSNQLSRLLKSLCEIADIEYESRQMSWYTIRHSTGTYLANERDIAAVKAQLRHENAKTSLKYDNVTLEQRRDALDNMG